LFKRKPITTSVKSCRDGDSNLHNHHW